MALHCFGWLSSKETTHRHSPQRDLIPLREMATQNSFSSHLFKVNAWNLQDNSSVNGMILFMQSFTRDIIRPNDGQDAPPDQASAFIELAADPKVWSFVQMAMPELWSNEGVLLAEQNPWIWAVRSVTGPSGGVDTGYDARTQARRRMVNTAAVVLAALNVLQQQVDWEMLGEIDAVKRVFATRLVGQMPQ